MASVFADCEPDLHHVGGTAVPGLASQPIVDMLIVVPDIHCLDRHLDELRRFGYTIEHDYIGPETIHVFKDKDGIRNDNIHILPQGHEQIDHFLAVKEYWEAFPEEMEEYSQKKLELFKQYPKNYESYREHRDAWLAEKKKNDILPWFNS